MPRSGPTGPRCSTTRAEDDLCASCRCCRRRPRSSTSWAISWRGARSSCDYPPEAQQKPIVSSSGLPENLPLGEIDDAVCAATAGETPLYRLDEARIAQIQPDLILTQDLCRVCAVPSGDVDEALGRLGCRAEVVSLDPHSLDEVMIDIQNVGRAAGIDARADLLVDSLRARMAAVEASVSSASVGRFGASRSAAGAGV